MEEIKNKAFSELKSPDALNRREAAIALGACKKILNIEPDLEIVNKLIPLLEDSDYEVREAVAESLGYLGFKESIPYLQNRLEVEKSINHDIKKKGIHIVYVQPVGRDTNEMYLQGLETMLTEEVQVDWNSDTQSIPVLKDMDNNVMIRTNDIIYNAFQQAGLCRGKPYEKLIMVIRDAIRDNVENVISGDILPEDAALIIQEDALRLRSGEIIVEESKGDGETEGSEDTE